MNMSQYFEALLKIELDFLLKDSFSLLGQFLSISYAYIPNDTLFVVVNTSYLKRAFALEIICCINKYAFLYSICFILRKIKAKENPNSGKEKKKGEAFYILCMFTHLEIL